MKCIAIQVARTGGLLLLGVNPTFDSDTPGEPISVLWGNDTLDCFINISAGDVFVLIK